MNNNDSQEIAADLAANAALLEMAEGLGLSVILDRAAPFTVAEAAAAADISENAVLSFLQALASAGLVEQGADEQHFTSCPNMADLRYEAGYLSWSLNANRPYIDHAPEFLRQPEEAGGQYQREGRRVAVSSRWVGSFGFYPGVISEIVSRKPQRIVDLGAGAAGLLIHLLKELPDSTGLALDMNAAACEEAERAARRADLQDRLTVVNRTVESLVDDPAPVLGAGVVHAGFVFHDVSTKPELFDRVLRTCRESLADDGCVIATDAVAYADNPRERAFSALFTYLHASSMGVRLPSEDGWLATFLQAGFSNVTSTPLRMPGARMFVSSG
jgi:predicted O-methyltransferase YrrM